MARLLVAALLAAALAVCGATAQVMQPVRVLDTGAYCNEQYKFMVFVSGKYLAFYARDSSSSSWTSSPTVTLYSYGLDNITAAPANVTLDYMTTTGWTTRVSWGMYDNLNDRFQFLISPASSSSRRRLWFSKSQCPASTTSQMPNGTYCGPNANATFQGNRMLWVSKSMAGAVCVRATTYTLDSTQTSDSSAFDLSTGVSAGSCSSFTYSFFSRASSVVSIRDASAVTTTLTKDTCMTTQTGNFSATGDLYCATGAGSDLGDTMLYSTSWNMYQMVNTPQRYSSSSYCRQDGMYTVRGQAVGLQANADTCYSYDELRLKYSKFYAANNSFVLATRNNYFFTARKCNTTVAAVPAGRYCGGYNAKMMVGESSLYVQTDYMDGMPACAFWGKYVASTGGVYLSRRATNCSSLSDIEIRGTGNGNVYVSFTRSATVNGQSATIAEGYAFNRSFCAATSMPAQVPQGRYCTQVSGANSTMFVSGNVFGWVLNKTSNASSSWIGSYDACAWGGTLSHRAGKISYRAFGGGCGRYGYSTQTMRVTDLSYVAAGQIKMTVVNSNNNYTVTTMTCALGNSSLTANNQYCPAMNWTAMPGGRMWVMGNQWIDIDTQDMCTVGGFINSVGSTNSTYTVTARSCYRSSSERTGVTKYLNNGASMYRYSDSYNSGGVVSAASCTNGKAMPAPVSGAWCGMAPASPTGGSGATGAKVSVSISKWGYMLASIETTNSANTKCYMRGMAAPSGTGYMNFMISGTRNCGSWTIRALWMNSNGSVTVTVRQSSSYDEVMFNAGACTGWEKGVPSGAFCGSNYTYDMQATVAGPLLWWVDMSSMRMYVRNITGVASATGNVTFDNNFEFYISSGGSTYRTTTTYDFFKVGADGLTQVSTSLGSYAYSQSICGGTMNPSWNKRIVLSSPVIAALGGRVLAVFQYGMYTISFPGMMGKRRTVMGMYSFLGSRMTLAQASRAVDDNNFYLYNAANSTTGAITLTIRYMYAPVAVTLSSASCANGAVPAGVYCTTGSTSGFICNNECFMGGAGYMETYCNITANSNGTLTVMNTMLTTGNWIPSNDLARYNAEAKVLMRNDFQSRRVNYASKALCSPQTGLTRTVIAEMPHGAYCQGPSVDTNITFFALPGGYFTLTFYPPMPAGTTASNQKKCILTGGYLVDNTTGAVDISVASPSASTSQTDCYFANGQSYYPPRVRFNNLTYFNDTYTLVFNSMSWKTMTGTAAPLQWVLKPGNCLSGARDKQTTIQKTVTPLLPTGGAWTTRTVDMWAWMYSVGDLYAFVMSPTATGGSWSFMTGTYTPATDPKALSVNGQQLPDNYRSTMSFANPRWVVGPISGSPFRNTTRQFNVDLINMQLSLSGSGYNTLPLGFRGWAQAQGWAGAAADQKAEEEKKKATVVIVVVVVAVIVVVVIAAIVVLKGKGGSQPAQPSGGDDYRPMNGV